MLNKTESIKFLKRKKWRDFHFGSPIPLSPEWPDFIELKLHVTGLKDRGIQKVRWLCYICACQPIAA